MTLLTNLHHIVLLVQEFDVARKAYETLFGFTPSVIDMKGADGLSMAYWRLENTGFEILGSSINANGEGASRVKELLGDQEARISTLVFETADLVEAQRVLGRRGLNPEACVEANIRSLGEAPVVWERFALDRENTGGVKHICLQDKSVVENRQIEVFKGTADQLSSLDHVVVNTPNPERAIALYGAKLGIRLALDRTHEKFGARMIFFKFEDAASPTIEVSHRLDSTGDEQYDDSLWGLAWRVKDIKAAHDRLSREEVALSEIRVGRKKGTRVFTVKSHTSDIPTLIIGPDDQLW